MKLGRPVKGTKGKKFSLYLWHKNREVLERLAALLGDDQNIGPLINEAIEKVYIEKGKLNDRNI